VRFTPLPTLFFHGLLPKVHGNGGSREGGGRGGGVGGVGGGHGSVYSVGHVLDVSVCRCGDGDEGGEIGGGGTGGGSGVAPGAEMLFSPGIVQVCVCASVWLFVWASASVSVPVSLFKCVSF
jgi:hypothetical protein